MISDTAADELAQSLLGKFVSEGFATKEMLVIASQLIKVAVKEDELRQRLNELEHKVAS